MKAILKYKLDRNVAIDEYQKLKQRLNEDRNFTGNSRGTK